MSPKKMKSSPHYANQKNSPTDDMLLNEYTQQEPAKNDLFGKRCDKQEKQPLENQSKIQITAANTSRNREPPIARGRKDSFHWKCVRRSRQKRKGQEEYLFLAAIATNVLPLPSRLA